MTFYKGYSDATGPLAVTRFRVIASCFFYLKVKIGRFARVRYDDTAMCAINLCYI